MEIVQQLQKKNHQGEHITAQIKRDIRQSLFNNRKRKNHRAVNASVNLSLSLYKITKRQWQIDYTRLLSLFNLWLWMMPSHSPVTVISRAPAFVQMGYSAKVRKPNSFPYFGIGYIAGWIRIILLKSSSICSSCSDLELYCSC